MAGSAVWIDVIPSMSKFGAQLSKGAGTAAKAAGVTAGRQFSAAVSAGSTKGAATAMVAELEGAAKKAARVVQTEKVAIAKARADEAAAAKGVEAAEAQLAAARVKNQAAASRIASADAQLAAARTKHGAASRQAATAEQSLLRAQAAASSASAGSLKAEQALIGARGRAENAGLKVVAVEDQLKAAFGEQKAVTSQLAAAQASGAKQTALMESRFGRLAAAGAPLSSGLGKVAQGAKIVAANALATLKPLAGMAAGFGAIIGVGQVIKLGNDYTATLNELQAVAGLTDAQMQKVSVTTRQLGSDLTLPATSGADAAAIMLELAKGGLSAADAMEAAKGTIQLAAAAQVDGGRAAEIQANSLNQFGLAAKDASMVADVLANTANAAAGGVDDIATSMKYVGPVAATLGINIADTAAAVGLLANNGLKGDTAGTALRGMLASLARPSKQAQKAVDALNLSVFDQQGQFVGLRAVIEQLSEARKTMTQEDFASQAVLAFGREPLAAVSALAKGGAVSFDQMAGAVSRQGGAAAVAQSKMKGLGGAMDKLQSQLEDVALGIYQTVTPALEAAVNGVAGFLDGASGKVTKFLAVAGGLGKLAFTGQVSSPIAGIDPAVVSGIQAAGRVVVATFRDIWAFTTQSLVPAVKNITVALLPVIAVVGGAFLGAFRAAAFLLAHVIGPALVGVSGFLRDNQAVVLLAAAAIGTLVLAYKAQQVQLAILAAGGLAKYVAATKLGVFWTNASTAAQVAWRAALTTGKAVAFAFAVATQGMTAAQVAFNIAASANPLGLLILGIVAVVAAIAALVAGIVWAYKNVGWFRDGVNAVWNAIVTAAKWAWETVLKPIFDGIVLVVRGVAAVFTWWWQNIITPVFKGVVAVVQWFWNTASAIFQLLVAIVRVTLGAAFTWLYNSVIKPVWNGISSAIQWAWNNVLKPAFTAIWNFLKTTLGPVFTWLYRNIIKPVWDGIKSAISTVWNNGIKPVFDTVSKFASKTIPDAFKTMKDAIGKAWKAIQDTAKAPIKFVVNTVINDALIGNFNKVAGVFGTKKIDPISLPKGFAGGGVIPGYQSARRDDVMTPMRRGEGVLVPEVVRALGPGFVHSLNAAGNRGGVSGVRKATGYASGGIVGAGKDILSGVIDTTRNAASLASDLVTDPAGTITNAVKALIGKIPGAGRMVELAGGFGRKVLDGAVESLKNMVGAFLPAGGSGANGSIPASQLGKAANYRPGGGVGAMGGYLRAPAAAAWNAMVAASGNMLTLTEGYRDLASQQYRWAQYKAGRGNLAAAPGTSVHGYGLAADIGAGQAWARANGARFGWYPTGLSFSQREPWHFEYKGAKAKGGMAAGGIVGGLQPTLYDKGGVLPRGLSLVQNNLRDPEVALPMQTLREIVSTEGGGTHYELNVSNNGRDLSPQELMNKFRQLDALTNG